MHPTGTTTPDTDSGPRVRVAVVGLGAMGARIAANLLGAGHAVTVANRSPAPAEALAAQGAHVAASPRMAAASADVTIACVTDDEASRTVWTDPDAGVLAGLAADAVGVETSTLSPGWVRELAGLAAARGRQLVAAPIVGSRPQADAGQLVHLVAGPDKAVDTVAPVLATSAARQHRVGRDHGQAAVLKLAVNSLLATQAAAVAELLHVTEAGGLGMEDTVGLLTSLPVTSPAAARLAAAMAAGSFAPNFPVRLVAKDLRYLQAAAAAAGVPAPVSQAVLDRYERTDRAGYGDEDLTAVIRTAAPEHNGTI